MERVTIESAEMASSDVDDDQDIDDFQDACQDELPVEMTLEVAVQQAQDAINCFFNNKFDEAKNLMKPWANVSMYHALGHSVFLFLEAMLTFEPSHVAAAGDALKHALHVCQRYRRRRNTLGASIGRMVVSPLKRGGRNSGGSTGDGGHSNHHFDHYTLVEAHAELCHAECLLLKSMLTFVEDETLSSFIKAGIKIRSCFNSYKDCQQILKHSKWPDNTTKTDFESGVKMGIGTFNLMISMLPSRVIKLLEFIGFSGNKQVGMQDLLEGYQMAGLRQILCVMTLLGYHLIVLYVLSHQEGDLQLCDDILRTQLERHPDGVWFLFFKGRLEFMRGNLEGAHDWYMRCRKSQEVWPQFHHFCYWELLWLHCIKTEWKEAEFYASKMLDGSKWSRTIYSYQKAAILLMQAGGDETKKDDQLLIYNLMKDVPKYKQRIAGKSLPMEKFAIRRAERFFYQKESLVLPMVELLYLWNMFKILRTSFALAERVLKLVEQALADLTYAVPLNRHDADNRAVLLLLKGACLRHMACPLQALECFEAAISLQKELLEDTYVVPYAIVELALLEWEAGNREKALLLLDDAKKNHSGYSLESRLHFRIHTAHTEFKKEMAA